MASESTNAEPNSPLARPSSAPLRPSSAPNRPAKETLASLPDQPANADASLALPKATAHESKGAEEGDPNPQKKRPSTAPRKTGGNKGGAVVRRPKANPNVKTYANATGTGAAILNAGDVAGSEKKTAGNTEPHPNADPEIEEDIYSDEDYADEDYEEPELPAQPVDEDIPYVHATEYEEDEDFENEEKEAREKRLQQMKKLSEEPATEVEEEEGLARVVANHNPTNATNQKGPHKHAKRRSEKGQHKGGEEGDEDSDSIHDSCPSASDEESGDENASGDGDDDDEDSSDESDDEGQKKTAAKASAGAGSKPEPRKLASGKTVVDTSTQMDEPAS